MLKCYVGHGCLPFILTDYPNKQSGNIASRWAREHSTPFNLEPDGLTVDFHNTPSRATHGDRSLLFEVIIGHDRFKKCGPKTRPVDWITLRVIPEFGLRGIVTLNGMPKAALRTVILDQQ